MVLNRTTFLALLLIPFAILKSQHRSVIYDSAPALASETKTFSGTIKKITDSTPLPQVEISVDGLGTVGFTDEHGNFSVKAPVNIPALNFEKEGFIGAREVIIPQSENTLLEINMFPEKPTGHEKLLIEGHYHQERLNNLWNEANKETGPLLKSAQKTQVPSVIRVLMPDNTVVTMNTDEYLKGVLPSEVPPSWDMDALKAQAVAARSYASVNFKHNSQGADVCTSTHCQAWKSTQYSRTSQAVTETSNFSIRYGGAIIDALFFSHCNGTTRNNEAVWGGSPVPYLRSKSCPCGFTSHNAHGVGMCQYGCQAMALKDSAWESILTWYYTGTTIDKTPLVYGSLKGVIYQGTDNTNLGNRITGATVKLSNGQEMVSDESGNYSFDLTPGQYIVTASKPGFNTNTLAREVTGGNTIWGSIQLEPALGKNTLLQDECFIYPNPAKSFLNIETPGEARAIVTNMSGKVEADVIINNKKTLFIDDMEKGIHIIKIIGADYITVKKFVVVN